ncbi:alpha-tectorin-like [Notolabrus celidotus]|uniref:alpha-tectorin-like n=1 Tax=Notolabrus celidotus TaxID=1203425 RepID=UPI00149054FE|nr:alpha-tectorin-like [Notolabrus celidotus]
MLGFVLYLAACGLLTGSEAMYQTFTSPGEVNISSCPITYFGQRYEKVFVSLKANTFAFCFTDAFSPGSSNNCILMSGGPADRGELEVFSRVIPFGSGVHKLLPDLESVGECVNVIALKDNKEAEIQQVELGNFGSQAILGIKTFTGYPNSAVDAVSQVNGQTVSSETFQTAETINGVITDISGCRLSGVVYKTNTTDVPNTCSTVVCGPSGVARVVSKCGPMQRCQGGRCVQSSTCTVAASAVIDFSGRVHTVPDRCGYTLLSPGSIPGLKVHGLFKERRRADVSFLDRVVLKLDKGSVEVVLEQGRVKLNGKVLELNATAQEFSGVELSKDQMGATAKVSSSSHAVTVFFDGDKALIQITGPKGTVQGLCGDNSGDFSGEKASEYSSSGCEVQHTDPADTNVDCGAATKWCNLLKQAPFSACNVHIDPEPFITACNKTLCEYPAVDGLKCKSLETYAMLCGRTGNVTLEDWRKKTGCSAQPSCQDKVCSDHEFCGELHIGGRPRCLCRAIFASKYRSENSYGEPTVCEHKSATVKLASCLLAEHGIDSSVLHLNDQTCRGEKDEETHMVKFHFDNRNTCGTVVQANDSRVIYKNTIMTQNVSTHGSIYRHDHMHVDFSCYYNQPDVKSMAVKLKHSAVDQHITSGAWSYNLTMKGYIDPQLSTPIESSTGIDLDERIWVELKTEGLDENLVHVVTQSCWATEQPSPDGTLRYNLIVNGCPNPADDTVRVENNGKTTHNQFSFNSFQFSGSTGDVYLHCKVQLCVKEGNNCEPTCHRSGRWRRSIMSGSNDENPALISMAWTS